MNRETYVLVATRPNESPCTEKAARSNIRLWHHGTTANEAARMTSDAGITLRHFVPAPTT